MDVVWSRMLLDLHRQSIELIQRSWRADMGGEGLKGVLVGRRVLTTVNSLVSVGGKYGAPTPIYFEVVSFGVCSKIYTRSTLFKYRCSIKTSDLTSCRRLTHTIASANRIRQCLI